MTRKLTAAELEAVDKILLDASIDLRNKLTRQFNTPVGVMITSAFGEDSRHGFAGFRGLEAAKNAVRRLVRAWAEKVH